MTHDANPILKLTRSLTRIPILIKGPFRYGIVAGIVGFVALWTLYHLGHHPFLILPVFDYRIILLSIFITVSLKEMRDRYFQGKFYFWQGMIGSFVLTGVFALTASSLLYLYVISEPEFVQTYIQRSLERLSTLSPEDIKRIGDASYQEGIRLLRETDAWFLAFRFFIQSFIISTFVSIIISIIIKRHP